MAFLPDTENFSSKAFLRQPVAPYLRAGRANPFVTATPFIWIRPSFPTDKILCLCWRPLKFNTLHFNIKKASLLRKYSSFYKNWKSPTRHLIFQGRVVKTNVVDFIQNHFYLKEGSPTSTYWMVKNFSNKAPKWQEKLNASFQGSKHK